MLSAAAAAGALSPVELFARTFPRRPDPPTRFWLDHRRFPLLVVGETFKASERVRKIETFTPLFGPERAVVNPKEPLVRNGHDLLFIAPGEYYLRVNGAPIKVLVFPNGEPLSLSLLRFFDFLVANNLYLEGQDGIWYDHREAFLDRFFRSDAPMMLTCGPMHQLFRTLVKRRFCVPTRFTSSASRFYQQGWILSVGHNVPEAYVPDLEKWVFFDLNNGVVPMWMDALELAQATRVWGDHAVDSETVEDLDVPIHAPVNQCTPSAKAFELVEQLGNRGLFDYSGELVSIPVTGGNRARGLRSFYGGTGYFGAKATPWLGETGTEFLDGMMQYVDLQTNEELRRDQRKALPAETEYVDVDEMRRRLDAGVAEQIARAEWMSRYELEGEIVSPAAD